MVEVIGVVSGLAVAVFFVLVLLRKESGCRVYKKDPPTRSRLAKPPQGQRPSKEGGS